MLERLGERDARALRFLSGVLEAGCEVLEVRVESTRAVLKPLDGSGGVGGELGERHGDVVGVPLDPESERAAAEFDVDADLGGDREAGELRDPDLGPAELGARGPLGELLAGGFALAQDRAVDGDLEAVAVGVAAAREQRGGLGDLSLAGADALLGERERALQGVAAALPRAFEALQAGEIGARLGVLEDQRVPGREGFDLGELRARCRRCPRSRGRRAGRASPG